MSAIKIEMVHDIVCSWCHIGYHNITLALNKLDPAVTVEFHYLPLQLNPQLGNEGVEIVNFLRQRNQWTQHQADSYRQDLLTKADEIGVVFDFSKRTHYYPTELAHRLILYAQQFAKQRLMHQSLLKAYHVDGADIGDLSVLLTLAQSLGFDQKITEAALFGQHITDVMAAAQARIQQFAIRSVPAFIINDQLLVNGSSSAKEFAAIFTQLTTSPIQKLKESS